MRPKYSQHMPNIWPSTNSKPNQENLELELFVWGVDWHHNLTKIPCCSARMSTQSLTVTGDHIRVSSKCVPHKKKKLKQLHIYIEDPGILVYISNPHYGPLHISVTTNPTTSLLKWSRKNAPNPPTKESTSRDAIGLPGRRLDRLGRCGVSWESRGAPPVPLSPRKITP